MSKRRLSRKKRCGNCEYAKKLKASDNIIFGGTGRKRIHTIENLITLCRECHKGAHSSKDMREWTYDWSRKRYGNTIDKLLALEWSGEKG